MSNSMASEAENAVEIDNTELLLKSTHLLYALSYVSITCLYVLCYEDNYIIMYSVWFNKTELGYEWNELVILAARLWVIINLNSSVFL